MAKQRRQRDRNEDLLQRVVADLEASDTPGHPSHRRAIRALLTEGPLIVPDWVHENRAYPDAPKVTLWRAELVTLLRHLVQQVEMRRAVNQVRKAAGVPTDDRNTNPVPVFMPGSLTYEVELTMDDTVRRRVAFEPDTDPDPYADSPARTVVREQLLRVIEFFGIATLRSCEAGCKRIFARKFGQRFCSQTCQDRMNKRKHRQLEADKKEVRARRRRALRRIPKA